MAQNSILLSNLSYDPNKGQITFGRSRYQMIRPEVIIDLQKAFEAEIGPERTAELMAAQSFEGGKRVISLLPNAAALAPAEQVELACIGLGELGWGRFDMLKVDLARKELYIEVHNSVFAEEYGPAESGVCHMIRGVLGGLATSLFGENLTFAETKCLSAGDDRCRFAITAQ